MPKIPFTVSARTAQLIGQQNFSSAEGAVIELVKNCYDADAKNAVVFFANDDSNPEKNALYIIDNGSGMTETVIRNNWMMIGTDNKESDFESDSGRIRTGAKGIGRFALDRLGEVAELYTIPSGKTNGNYWKIDWSAFKKKGASRVTYSLSKKYFRSQGFNDTLSIIALYSKTAMLFVLVAWIPSIGSSQTYHPGIDTEQSSQALGSHARDIIAKPNARSLQQMGYQSPVTPPAVNTHAFIINQYKKPSAQKVELNHILRELNEIRSDKSKDVKPDYYSSEDFKLESVSYWKAKEVLENMLSGKTSLSLKDAFYSLENAYGNTHLTYTEYNATLKKSAQFIKQWLNEHGHATTNNDALHFGIQTFMRDTLTVSQFTQESMGGGQTKHFPFRYDYVDFRAEEDFRNYFVTKTLATGTGQCNSLPTTYLLLAEQLGAKAYLSFAPLHSFIKFPDQVGAIHNYEPTTHFQISDQWYASHLRISPQAYKNKIYLDTLDKKQIVAAAMLDLAYGYLRKHGVADGVFINDCVATAIQYFPGKVANVQAWLLRNTLLVNKLHRILQRDGILDLKDINKSPQGMEVYSQLSAIDQLLDELGYEELPTDMYKQLMQQQNTKAQKQTTDTKTKRDLFTNYK